MYNHFVESLTMTENFNKPFWHVNAGKLDIADTFLPSTIDTVIVGSGFTGLAIALHLLRAGKSVALFDAMKVGFGASGKNGGMVGPSLHKLGLEGLTNRYGKKKALEILQEGMNAIEYFESFIKEEAIDCDLQMTGRFRGVTNQRAFDTVVRESENLLSLDGFKFDVVDKTMTHNEIGSDLYHGGGCLSSRRWT